MQNSDEVSLRLGFGKQLERKNVELFEGDIPPYQPDDDLSVVGKTHPRLDGVAKVTGRARYAYDQQPQGLLYGRILRCPHPNADVKSVDLKEALAMPGVRAAISFPEVFETRSVRFAWEGVAAVAAVTEAQANAALEKIKVEYEVRPFCVTREDSMKPGAPQVGRGDQQNVVESRPRRRRRRGPSREEVMQEIASADHTIEGVFETQVHTHSPLETHGATCEWKEEQLICYASTQATFGVQQEYLRRGDSDNVRVFCEYVGGGFGSKFSAGREGVAGALLAKKAGAPVKLMLDRREEHTSTGNRPDSLQKIQMGLNRDGKVVGYASQVWGTPGPGVRGAGAHNDVIYNLGKTHKQEFGVRTNCGGARALRAPAWPQGVFALEQMMDMAAEKIDKDPIEFRKQNDFHPIRPTEYDIARVKSGWDQKRNAKAGKSSGPIKTGLGVGSSIWFQAGGPRAAVKVRIYRNGKVEVRNGAQDIGTGTRTIMGQVVAEELGLTLKEVTTFIGDTNDPPGPGSGGSTTSPTITPAARLAAFRAKEELLELVAEETGIPASSLELDRGRVVKDTEPMMSFAEACGLMIEDSIEVTEKRRRNTEGFSGTNAGVQVAEVEVDTETGEVRVKRVTAVADAGQIINPKLAESQVRGGVIQGVSYALFERRIMDRQEGRMVNADLENYKIVGAVDCPEIDVTLLDVVNGINNTNVMGLGEPPIVATAAAVANAVYNAIGVRITSLPITPRKVLEALARQGGSR